MLDGTNIPSIIHSLIQRIRLSCCHSFILVFLHYHFVPERHAEIFKVFVLEQQIYQFYMIMILSSSTFSGSVRTLKAWNTARTNSDNVTNFTSHASDAQMESNLFPFLSGKDTVINQLSTVGRGRAQAIKKVTARRTQWWTKASPTHEHLLS